MSDAYYEVLGCLGNIFRIVVISSVIGLIGFGIKKLTGIRINK